MSYPVLPTNTTTEERARGAAVALLPVGSFEQHGPHLPLATDSIIAATYAAAVAEVYPVLQLPPVTIACSHEHSSWSGTASVSARTLHTVITDVYESVTDKEDAPSALVVVNAHGGNYVLSNVVQEANARRQRMALWPTTADVREARAAAGLESSMHEDMHAGEVETSILLHAHPELVRAGWERANSTFDDRRHLLTLGVDTYTDNGVIGRPSLASATKGQAVLDALSKSFGATLETLDATHRPK